MMKVAHEPFSNKGIKHLSPFLPLFFGEPFPLYRIAVKRIVKHPKGYLRDSGLLHYLLRIHDIDSLLAHPTMGQLWEGMVIEEIIRGFNCLGTGFDYYYRTAAGLRSI